MPDDTENRAEGLTTIVLAADETTSRFGRTVPIPVNGKIAHLEVGKPTPVGEHILSALDGAGIRYTRDPAEGATGAAPGGVSGAAPFSADDTQVKPETPLTDRNTPDGTVHADQVQGETEKAAALEQPTELIPTPAPKDSQENAAGGVTLENGVNSADGNEGNTATKGENVETGTGSAGQPSSDKQTEPGPLDGSIPALAEHLKTVNDPAEIDRLIAAEKGGKSRIGAMDALEARKAEMAAQ